LRDDFTTRIKKRLAERVANHCSNPECQQTTSGPQEDPEKSINVGVAAHITAASENGPRFDPSLTPEQRQSIKNGIWLCQTCAKLIDNDQIRYNVDTIRKWKKITEENTSRKLEAHGKDKEDPDEVFKELEAIMPDILNEMREDLASKPLSREFVILKKGWCYWATGHELVYYFEDHPELENKLRILENNGLIKDITREKVSRYKLTEGFVRYLNSSRTFSKIFFTYSGTGPLVTPPFKVHSSPFKLLYIANWDGHFGVEIRGGLHNKLVVNHHVISEQENPTYVYDSTGNLHFAVVVAPPNGQWTLTCLQ
jgi:hypothetical protein